MKQGPSVLISGASVAGPALAYWLGRRGFRPTVVEIAPALRAGGYAVDFRGPVHLGVLERMGILGELRRLQTGGTALTFVDASGRELFGWPADFAGGELEVTRSDLSRALYEHSRDTTEYVFGDTITSLTETPGGVEVTFENATPRTFDLVIGADGLHSTVRRLAFGPEQRYVTGTGYRIAGWDVPGHLAPAGESLLHTEPGRMASVGRGHVESATAGTMMIFYAPGLAYDRRDLAAQRRIIADAYAGMGWRTPSLIEALADAPDLYFDEIARVDIEPWSTGRVALLGDAACGATLGGMGTGTAVVGAYLLAGELATAGGDHRAAFARYEGRLRDYARTCQKGGERAGPFFAPRTRLGVRARNAVFGTRAFRDWMIREGQKITGALDLPDYPTPARTP